MSGNSQKSAKKRRGKPWAPGQSGNPSGRAKLEPELKATCRALTSKVVERLRSIVESGEDKDATAAGKLILAYAWGHPTQPISGDADRPPVSLSLEPALRRLAEAT